MKKIILLSLLLVCLLASCNFLAKGGDPKGNTQDPSEVSLQENDLEPSSLILPAISGPITKVPWSEDPIFLSLWEENDSDILLAAYATVLKDPLPGEEYNVHLAAGFLCGKTINPGQVFSQNKSIGPYVESKGYQKGPTYINSQVTTTIGGGVCKISSTLYNVAILSNLEIIERHNHGMPVPYVPYGQDATVAYGSKDFKFKNNKKFPILIWAQGIENVLFLGFYGKERPPKVEWHHEFLEIRSAAIEYKLNPKLEKGETKLVVEGMDGAVVKSSLTITYPDGHIETKHLGISSYKPMPSLIEINGNN